VSTMITMGYALPNPWARKSSTRAETSDRPLSPIPTKAGNGCRWSGRTYRSIASLSSSSACSSGSLSTNCYSLSLLVTRASYVDPLARSGCATLSRDASSSRHGRGLVASAAALPTRCYTCR